MKTFLFLTTTFLISAAAHAAPKPNDDFGACYDHALQTAKQLVVDQHGAGDNLALETAVESIRGQSVIRVWISLVESGRTIENPPVLGQPPATIAPIHWVGLLEFLVGDCEEPVEPLHLSIVLPTPLP